MYDINYIIKLLNIQDKNITIVKFDLINSTYKVFTNQLKDFSTACLKYDNNVKIIKHITINRYSFIIIFKQIKFLHLYQKCVVNLIFYKIKKIKFNN